jgi:ABC-type branched-subunit amino acid transport system substrate-binding protein
MPMTSSGSGASAEGLATVGGPGAQTLAGQGAAGDGIGGAGTAAGQAGIGGPVNSGTAAGGAGVAAGGTYAGPTTTNRRRVTTPVQIGIQLLDMGEALQLGSSAGNCDSACQQSFSYNQDKMVTAVANWANANGGIAGRKIELVKYTAKFADYVARGGAVVDEESCQYWTKDHKVSALILPNVVNPNLIDCAVRNNLPIINGDFSQYVPDKVDLTGKGRFDYASANFNGDDAAKNYVNALIDQGFLKPTNKVGLIFKEDPSYQRAIKNALVPELRRHGIEIAANASWTDATAGDSQTWTQYVVKFQGANIDRVIGFGGWSFGMAGFMKAADNQKYYPRYGVSSMLGPADLRIQGAPASQLKDAVGVGWWTFADVLYTGDAGTFNPAAATCKKIIVGAGQPWSAYVYRNAMKFCDVIFLLKTLADRAGEVSQPGFYAAADQLGSSYTSPYMWATTFRPGNHHGATYLRNLAFDEGCDCFKYVGKMYLPRA